jgi:ParB family chromosome partitioning protein
VILAEGQRALFSAIVSEGLSVREAEERAQKLNAGSAPRPAGGASPAPKPQLPEIAHLEQRFIERLGTKVLIKGDGKKGRIEISYFSADDLERLYEILGSPET